MNTLILDCSAGMSIYLLKNEEIFSFIDNNQKRHTDELLLTVDKILNEAKLKIQDIDNVGICIGPGSFTGIRVATSIAKGLSIGSNLKIFTCSNFDIYSIGDTGSSIYILEGFSKFVYARILEDNKFNDYCIDINELVEKIKTKYMGFNIYVQNEKLQNQLKLCEISAKIARNNTILCFKQKIELNDYEEINKISPIYLRASQAEIERNEKLKKANTNG